MYIKELYIGAFGAIRDRAFSFSDGVNLIEGRNETGKSTLCAFIKFIFYGLSGKTRGGMPERKRYLPFDGSAAQGTLTLCTGGRAYCISRTVTASARASDTYRITDCVTGEEVFHGIAPCDAFLHMSEGLYTHTAYVPQLTGTTVEGTEVAQAIENLLSSAQEKIDSAKTLRALDGARAELLHKNGKGGKLFEARAQREQTESALAAARGAVAALERDEEHLAYLRDSEQKNARLTEQAEQELGRYERARSLIAFDEAKKLTDRAAALEQKRAALIPAGGTPSAEDIHDLVRLSSAIAGGAAALERAQMQERAGDEPPIHPIEQDGGTAAVCRRLRSQARLARILRTGGVLALVCAAVFLAVGGGAAMGAIDARAPFAMLGCGALTLFGGVLLLIGGRAKSAKYRAMLDRYGVNELAQVADRALRAQSERLMHEKEARDRAQSLAALHAEQEARLDRARALCAAYGTEYADESSLETLAVRLTAVRESLTALDAQILRAREQADEAYAALADCDERTLRDEFDDPYAVCASLDPKELKNRLTVGRASRENQRAKIVELEKALITERLRAEQEEELTARLAQQDAQIRVQEQRYEALRLAYEKMEQAAGTVKEQISPSLAKRAGELLAAATDGKYRALLIGDGMSLSYADSAYGGQPRDADHLSRGTKDLAYIALRIALCELLCPEEQTPMIFDESFAALDDNRARALFSLIAARDGQSFVLTSQTRDRELLAPSTVIEL